MNKGIFCAVLMLLAIGSASAQTGNFRFGFQTSPTLTWLDSDNKFINSNGTNLGLRLGMRGDYFFGNSGKYALSSGIGFAFNQGGTLLHDRGGILLSKSELSSETLRVLPDMVELKYSVRYIEVPVGLLMLTDQIFRDFRFFFNVPYLTFGFKSQAIGDIMGASATGQNSEDENIKKDVNAFHFTWGIGGGAEYNIRGNSKGDTNIYLGIFYNQGFTDITDDKATTYVSRDEFGNPVEVEEEDSIGTIRGLTLQFGVMF